MTGPLPPFFVVACGVVSLTLFIIPATSFAQDGAQLQRLLDLEQRVDQLEKVVAEVEEAAGLAFFVLFLFGVVLAMWAQRRGQSGCLWFILGIIPVVNIFAAMAALLSNEPGSPRRRE